MTSHYRPLFHFSAASGWINDPNGLVWHDGLWHLHYQHAPSVTRSERMHWGHAVTRDFTHWEHWPVALEPDELGAIYSGSAARNWQNTEVDELVACFTHAEQVGQVQSLAFSRDGGRTWRKYAANPVLNIDRRDFRDPAIFRHGDEWRMVVSAGHEAQIYGAPNLTDWRLLSTFPAPIAGWVWECPTLIPFGDRWALWASFLIPDIPKPTSCRTMYWIGDFDGATFTPTTPARRLCFGPDDYAAIAWSDAPANRKVIIGWMNAWCYSKFLPSLPENWVGAMTLPRELSLVGDTLHQNPPPEVSARRGAPVTLREGEQYEGDAYEIEATIDMSGADRSAAGFRVCCGEGEATEVFYNPAGRQLGIDRRQSGQSDFAPEFAGIFGTRVDLSDGILKLRIFVDHCSVEVFAQDGAYYGAALIFPAATSRGIQFFGEGARLVEGTLYSFS